MRAALLSLFVLAAPAAAFAEDDPAASADQAQARAIVDAAAAWGLAHAKSEAERSVIGADLAFAKDAGVRGAASAFADRMAADGMTVSDGQPPRIGPDAVRAAFQGSTAEWRWAPYGAEAKGDVGVTWGVAAISYHDASGALKTARTRYVTVWKKEKGAWKIKLDTGTEGPAPDFLQEGAKKIGADR